MASRKRSVIGGMPRSVRDALKVLRNPSGDGKTKLSVGFAGEPLKSVPPCSRCGGDGIDPESRDCTCDCCSGSGVER